MPAADTGGSAKERPATSTIEQGHACACCYFTSVILRTSENAPAVRR